MALEDKAMKKFAAICLLALFLGGCSAKKDLGLDGKMDWERDDQTVKMLDLVVK